MSGIARRRHVFEGRALTGLVLGAVLGLVLAGCTSDGNGNGSGALKVAQAKVSAKEKALSAAKADVTAAIGGILRSERDVHHGAGPVRRRADPVGRDGRGRHHCGQPTWPNHGRTSRRRADAAVAAQQAVADAKNELADAEAALVALQSPSASATSSPKASASPKPLVPAGTVNRVKEAETELATAQQGITDETPLAQASEQFNAAVVALEMSWLKLTSPGRSRSSHRSRACRGSRR